MADAVATAPAQNPAIAVEAASFTGFRDLQPHALYIMAII
jgi:hypothetical protein